MAVRMLETPEIDTEELVADDRQSNLRLLVSSAIVRREDVLRGIILILVILTAIRLVLGRTPQGGKVIPFPQRQPEPTNGGETSSAEFQRLPVGELLSRPEPEQREYIRMLGRRVVERNREAAAILEAYDRGELVKR